MSTYAHQESTYAYQDKREEKEKSIYKADIVNNIDFKWTQKDISGDTVKIPYVKLFAWENKTNEALQNYLFNQKKVTMSMIKNIDSKKSDFYEIYNQLYMTGKRLANIRVPYRGLYPYSITSNYSEITTDPTSWKSTIENIENEIGRLVENVNVNMELLSGDTDEARTIRASSGKAYHKQTIKMFNSAEPNQYETTFPLLNESPEFTKKHLEFILTMQSLLVPNLKTINIIELPALWRFEIPGIMVIPFGFIGKFTATPKGPSKVIPITLDKNRAGPITIPNAWEIHIVFNSLTPPSVQMQDLLWLSQDKGFEGMNDDIYGTFTEPQPMPAQAPKPAATPASAAASTPRPFGNRFNTG